MVPFVTLREILVLRCFSLISADSHHLFFFLRLSPFAFCDDERNILLELEQDDHLVDLL
jgi:hypothetical protein